MGFWTYLSACSWEKETNYTYILNNLAVLLENNHYGTMSAVGKIGLCIQVALSDLSRTSIYSIVSNCFLG